MKNDPQQIRKMLDHIARQERIAQDRSEGIIRRLTDGRSYRLPGLGISRCLEEGHGR